MRWLKHLFLIVVLFFGNGQPSQHAHLFAQSDEQSSSIVAHELTCNVEGEEVGHSNTDSPPEWIGGASTTTVVDVPCIITMGQSNGDGNAQSERLANTLWNFKGIEDVVWGTTRTSQPQYVTNPAGVHVFFNQRGTGFQDWSTPAASWQAYVMGTNSRNRLATGQATYFGHDGLLAQLIRDSTGKEVALVRPAFPGTSIALTGSSIDPGNWLNICRTIATENFIKKAPAAFVSYRPTARLRPVCVEWWQGEGDAGSGRTTAQYITDFTPIYSTTNEAIRSAYVLTRDPIWNLIAVDTRTAAGTQINNALIALAASLPNVYYIDVHLGKTLLKGELTATQASPLTKGVNDVTPNAAGGYDDFIHLNYIAHELVAGKAYDNIVASGILTP